MKLSFRLPLPASTLSPNARKLWWQKCGDVRTARDGARLVAISTMNEQRIWTPPRWERATTQVRFYFPTKRRRDADNFMASLKSTFDGLADAGIVANDSGFTHQPPEMNVDKVDPRVEIDVWVTTPA